MRLELIKIQTNAISKAIEFYNKILGLSILEKDPTSVSFQVGTSVLKFTENKDFDSVYHLAFNIPENKLNQAIQWCTNKADLIKIDDSNVIKNYENWNANAIYFYDNNGNILEFIARHDLNNHQAEQFGTNSILNISEIGLVHETPLLLGQELINKHGLDFFSKNYNSDNFTAIGDDEGLLIIVKPYRNWYPTQTPSQSNKTEIRLENNSTIIELEF